jgi:hypothetical protein
MTEAVQQQCRFFLLRYVPDPAKGEFVNFGLALLPPEGPPELRFAKDWSRVKGLDPQADLELLDAFRSELTKEFAKKDVAQEFAKNDLTQELDQKNGEQFVLRMLHDSFSNVLQASDYKACLTAAPAQEADELARIYLEAPRRGTSWEQSARQKIFQSMQAAFTETGVWDRMQRGISVSKYSRPGDPLKIDCGYQTNSSIRMFHATSLKTEVTAAKVLAFSYPELAAGIRRMEGAQAYLTAIIEDNLEKTDHLQFALETLERNTIQVATVSDLPALAQMAARELGNF